MSLFALMEAGTLPPLAFYFARFVARGCAVPEDGIVATSAALVSARNLEGDVCIDLAEYAGLRLFAEETGQFADGKVLREDEVDDPSFEVRAPELSEWLDTLAACPWVGQPGDPAALILDNGRLYLGKYWHFEHRVAGALRARMAPVAELDRARLASGLGQLFPGGHDADEVDWQRIAAAVAVTRRFAVISGGPGTGKTTTVVKVLALLLEQEPGLRMTLAAPTGKAAARLTESVGAGKRRISADGALAARTIEQIPEQAQTIHRLLGYGADGLFRRGRDNPLPVDCLVVDEASMVDLPLMARLLDALPPSARLLLLGDRDQLASVEAGNVLGDITGRGRQIRYGAAELNLLSAVGAFSSEQREAIACELGGPEDDDVSESPGSGPPSPATAVALLRHSWRFGADSGIGALARAVNLGDGERALQLLDDGEHRDISRLAPTPSGLNPACVSWAVERFSAIAAASGPEDALRVLERARVLCALHRGPFGVEALNAGISTALLASGRLPRFSGDDGTRDGIGAGNHVGLHHAMPLMVTANDYEVGLFNGDVGLLWQDAAGRPRAHFHGADGALRTLTLRQLPPYRCAYALTVHKSQGSEFDDVLLVLPPEPHPLATRELLYTAVTRARRQVLVHAGEAVIRQASQARVRRASALAERLGWFDHR